MSLKAITSENLLGDSPFLILISVISFDDIPYHDALVSGSCDEELSGGVAYSFFSNLHASNPSVVAYTTSLDQK